MDKEAIASHLIEIGTIEWLVQIKVHVHGNQATMICDDGKGKDLASQEILYTDFPMAAVSLYACWYVCFHICFHTYVERL